MRNSNLSTQKNIKVTADDDVPPEVRRIVSSRVERVIQGAGTGDFLQVTIRKRKNPNEIYDVRLGGPGNEFQHDFERGDLDSEQFDLWLQQNGKHLDTNCWCGHPPADHSLPQCTSCEV